MGLKPDFFKKKLYAFGSWDPFQGLLQALTSNFPSKMCDLDAYVSSYSIFRRFCRVWKVAEPFLIIWDSFFINFVRTSLLPNPCGPFPDPAV